MTEVGIRALKQNASAVVARAARGEIITITDHGRPVARLTPLPVSPFEELAAAGKVSPAVVDAFTPEPLPPGGRPLSELLLEQRDEERY